MTTATKPAARYHFNGIKIDGGPLSKGHWSFTRSWTTVTDRVIPNQLTLYGKDLNDFDPAVSKLFTVENDTDGMTDYYEDDRIRIPADHPEFPAAIQAWAKQQERAAKQLDRRHLNSGAASTRREIEEVLAKFAS